MTLKHRPQLQYALGAEISRYLDDRWAQTIARITAREKHLLPQTREAIREAALKNHFLVVIDTVATAKNCIVGFCGLWLLRDDEHNRVWYEFGSVWVHPDYRWKSSGIPVSDEMYHAMLDRHSSLNILATTTNRHAIQVGQRVGLHRVQYKRLPVVIQAATCCCPAEKRKTEENGECELRDTECLVRVPLTTYVRLGSPPIPPFPDPPPTSSSAPS